jgi:tetratricopeptide (TPR) repeat protein
MAAEKRALLALLVLAATALYAQDNGDALAEYRAGNYEQAVAICRNEIIEKPNNLDSYIVLCWGLLRLNHYTEAIPYAKKASELARHDARVIEIQGEIDYFGGHNDIALKHFQNYVSLAPEGTRIDNVYYYMGEIYIRLGRYKHADIAISTALHYSPNNAMWWTRLGYVREISGDAKAAFDAYHEAVKLNPHLSTATNGEKRVRATLHRP